MNAHFTEAMEIFATPKEFYPEAKLMLTDAEIELIYLMGDNPFSEVQLQELIQKHLPVDDAEAFIRKSYARCIIRKARNEKNELLYMLENFKNRFLQYAQFEYDDYGEKIPRERKEALAQWDVEMALQTEGVAIQRLMDGEDIWCPDGNFMTIEETDRLLDYYADTLYVVPCNCKSMMYYHDRPLNVCIRFEKGDNSQYDRGFGEDLTLDQAKSLVRKFNSQGLMQNGDARGFCSCDGFACVPIQQARILDSRGVYPRANYRITWHEELCINCGKCTRICNFQAFTKGEGGRVNFDPDKCWGCTICYPNCPKHAISIERKADARDPFFCLDHRYGNAGDHS